MNRPTIDGPRLYESSAKSLFQRVKVISRGHWTAEKSNGIQTMLESSLKRKRFSFFFSTLMTVRYRLKKWDVVRNAYLLSLRIYFMRFAWEMLDFYDLM